MRRPFLVGTLLKLTVVVGAAEPPISGLERQRLVAHMEMTASWLEDEVRGLSTAQADFRPAPNAWTILENTSPRIDAVRPPPGNHAAIVDGFWKKDRNAGRG